MKNNQKGFVFSIVLAVVAVVIAGVAYIFIKKEKLLQSYLSIAHIVSRQEYARVCHILLTTVHLAMKLV